MKVFVILMLTFCGAYGDKVIGGTAAWDNQFPSIVYQMTSGRFFCGGTIIAANRVLTAAHCEQDLAGLTVTGGTNTRDQGGTTIEVTGKLVHEMYNPSTYQYDIQLLYLASSFSFSNSISAANLAYATPPVGSSVTVVGWGDTNPGIIAQTLPDDVQYVGVEVISTTECNAADAYDGTILDGMVCIGNMAGGTDTCQGDSGGPAYAGMTSTIVGITSWGYGCAQPNNPGVYTDVAYFREWITTNM